MTPVRVELSTTARRAYNRLLKSDRRLFERVRAALEQLAHDPYAGKALHGALADRRSLRVGPIRIIYRYEEDRLIVFVMSIRQRGGAYR